MQQLLEPINQFLGCETPDAWVNFAKQPAQLNALLIDHCNCELKAAQTAMMMIRKYAIDKSSAAILLAWAKPYETFVYSKERDVNAFLNRDVKKNDITSELVASQSLSISADLMTKMVRLIKEEFHHFEQVLQIMTVRGIEYSNMRAGRYAKQLMSHVRTHEPLTIIDKLIIGAFIEARSCERFAKLAPHLDDELTKFYVSLLRSEARHYQDYLALAQDVAGDDISDRIAYFRQQEAALILSEDNEFRFHSGTPV
ncbi:MULTISPECIES: tRNA isopentenyl-2-thiomethyl-A-37 hydroxylase MiaE [Shewanella]|uniref:tRNA isopentenyl-2-thiomethyl-A-37 hydroxylase MiaE n=1 Tax=Shewanella metallivivens TaxID=2872342 RepID=A0ABT5TKP1_9GAMM|nr:tRNA isopentenyl-2-thiomethyl-A-37 hydroxylase MiaE [Shewanella metallivivens]MDD8059170.1 tRNA isopentenyl-2-thiomethyl-A-37 hydroxylase MiaE [Shewanella metallivivens]